jgi:capsid protein
LVNFECDTMSGGIRETAFSQAGPGYDATEATGRRRAPMSTTSHEDVHADERRRKILSATSRDLVRNWAIASWAVRKHLDYVADFTFQAKTEDAGFNKDFEDWHAIVSKKENFDVAARHPLRRRIRLAEAGKTVDGDVGWMKLLPPVGDPRRGRIQVIEGDCIGTPKGNVPKGFQPSEWMNGIHYDPQTGRTLEYGLLRRRGRTSKEYVRSIAAENMLLHAAYEFRNDQLRGISPITASLNQFRDSQEGFEYALAKVKVSQMFGLSIFTEGQSNALPAANSEDADGDGVADSGPRVNLNRGPFVMELDAGERAEFLEARTPSTETVAFLKLIIMIVLRSLDIPFSFFDESFTNFYGSRGGLMQYLHACHQKVLDLQDFLNEWTAWRVWVAIEDGELQLPSGKGIEWIVANGFEYVPGGVPWWDPTKEVRGAAMSVAAGFTSPQRVCRETGTSFEQNIREIAAAQKFAEDEGVKLVYADSSAFAPEITVGAGNVD